MPIYHCCVKIIGRGTGRSAVAAAAYRSGEKLHNEYDGITHDYTHRRSVISAAAYRSGERLNAHDFTNKNGIIYSEIMLPQNARKELKDRFTLGNSVEKSERNSNAQLAREIVVALPNELTDEQKIKIIRDYVKRNFVNAGMCADYSIHSGHKGTEHEDEMNQDKTIKPNNPHAHIMLTMRPINPDGSWGAKSKKEYILDKNGNKIKLKSGEWKSRKIDSTNWDKKETLLKWREDWALTVNKELERLGISERIDHRTLEAQGVDRLPTIHLGYEASKLEKTGIKTHKGDINRERANINAEVARINTIILLKQREIEHIRLISNPIKPKESVRDYIRNARAQDTRPNRNRPDRDKFSRDIEHER